MHNSFDRLVGRGHRHPIDMTSGEARQIVWLVDDSQFERELTGEAVPSGCEIEHFNDGLAMLERLAAGSTPALLVVDWRLSDITGLEICKSVRERFDEARLPIVVTSAYHRGHEDLVEALGAGANDFVSKPFRAAELKARIETLLRVQRAYAKLSAR